MNIIFKTFVPLILLISFLIFLLFPDVIPISSDNFSDIISFLTVFLTYVYVVLTGETVRQMKKTNDEEKRPYVIADFEYNNQMVSFYIKNIGKTAARNLEVKVTPDLKLINNRSVNKTLFAKPITIIPPNKEIKTIIKSSAQQLSQQEQKVYEVILQYKWGTNKKVEEKYELDISYRKGVVYRVEKDMHDLVEVIEKIDKKLDRNIRYNKINVSLVNDDIKVALKNRSLRNRRQKKK